MLELATKQPNSNTSIEAENNATNNDHHNNQPHFSDESNIEYEASTQSTTPPSINSIIKRNLLLLTPLLICLYILTDSTHHNVPTLIGTTATETQQQQKQHLAFVTALSRHPPALRVFRIVSESAFLLFCTAFALWAWETCRSSGPLQSNHHIDDDESLEQSSNQSTITISSQSIGKLLFSPPPNSITDNAAWMVYKKHHHRLLFRTRKRRTFGSNGGGMSRNEEDLIEFQPQQPDQLQQQQQQQQEEEDEGFSSLLMDTPSQNMRLRTQHDLLVARINDNHDDNYVENDHNGNGNEHDPNTETMFEEPAAVPLPKPPSSASVLGAALDITTLMCMFLIFFTISSAEGGRYIDHKARGGININPSSNHITTDEEGNNNREGETEDISYMKFFAKIAAPLFPITLFIMSALLLIIPWRKRKVLWTIVSLTLGAPSYEVTFRDGFIGDILTSTVRPLQDLAYTVVFLFLGLQSWWDSQAYNNSTTATEGGISLDDVPLERSWLLHTFILPACTLSPLWWRFLQNLRQCFDSKQRWPYLGNAFKYMLAAEVAIFGMFDPSVKKHPVWITCFFVATLYQVWWDVFMDWGLLEWNEDEVAYRYYHSKSSNGSDGGGRKGLFWWWPYKLRSRRAYPHRWIYYTIFIINFCLRFVGMLTLIPPVYLSRRTGLVVNTWYDPDVQLFVGSMAASAEIFRRTIWALLRLEWEVIKTSPSPLMSGKNEVDIIPTGEDDDLLDLLEEETDMKPMAISSSSSNRGGRLGFLTSNERWPRISLVSLSDMSNLNGIQILSELCAWATIFSGIAIIAAAHREIL